MLNLFDYLTELDNERIKNYVASVEAREEYYCGNNQYLRYWAEQKKHLFHLLGGNLIYRFPVQIKKSHEAMRQEFYNIETSMGFCDKFRDQCMTKGVLKYSLSNLINVPVLLQDQVTENIKDTKEVEGKTRTLQIQKGMKPIRAIQKVIDFYDMPLKEEFEQFRLAHSVVLNDKYLKGNLCLSIHPLDFMTMSDNTLGWSSCMSWTSRGCYRAGTVEMLNSNNVICCYLESAEPYNFNKDHVGEEAYQWNNKKWRQLFYVTKEIAVCGKAYPYHNKELSLAILDKIKELTETNLHKTYTYGPEPYRDMNHIGSNNRMRQQKAWIRRGDTTKKNIIFDSKIMYNDMFNDHDKREDLYWCYRNKVKKNTVICYSGKAPCACCGRNYREETSAAEDNYEGAYNDRYDGTGQLICPTCRATHLCDHCHSAKESLKSGLYNYKGHKYCESCLKDILRTCPSCGKTFEYTSFSLDVRVKVEEPCSIEAVHCCPHIVMCRDCLDRYLNEGIIKYELCQPKNASSFYRRPASFYLTKKAYPLPQESEWANFLNTNVPYAWNKEIASKLLYTKDKVEN